MGSCLSVRSSEPEFHTVRVVHLNGYVEDFDQPISVSHVTNKPGRHFVSTASNLLSLGAKPMRPDTLLETGRIYFLLPYSAFQADMSPLDLVSVVKKLSALAKSCPSNINTSSIGGSSSPFMSPTRVGFGVQRLKSWKPILDPIREKSFNRRSESELEMHESCFEGFRMSE